MWILTRLPERVLRAAAAGAGLCAIYFLQNASRPATFLRRVPKGFFSTTSSLEESSLDADEDDDALAAVDAGAAASSVLAYLEARSSMSFVCHSKKPSLTFFFGATASLPATAEKPAVEQGLFLRAAGRGGERRLARSGRAIAGAGARANPRGQMPFGIGALPSFRGDRELRERTGCSGKAASDDCRPDSHRG